MSQFSLSQNNFGTFLSRLKLFWALSRTPHALLDMAHPAVAALLCLGQFPSLGKTLLGMVTVFSGYTAVYALNDVVDFRSDKEKMAQGLYSDSQAYLDGVLVRHPMAKGDLSLKQGLLWIFLWSLLALVGAYLLNPVCMYIFIGGCVLEGIYCMLWRVSPLRALVNGCVKPLGAMAAMYAVNPSPPLILLISVFLWIFFWEIGGQNIPADWADIEEDRRFNAKTIPVILGSIRAGILLLVLAIISFFLNIILFLIAPISFNLWAYLFIVVVNCYLLLLPALRLIETNDRADVITLFNKSSYLPLSMLIITLFSIIF